MSRHEQGEVEKTGPIGAPATTQEGMKENVQERGKKKPLKGEKKEGKNTKHYHIFR